MSNELMDLGQRLANVLATENEALSRLDFAAAVVLFPAKEAALASLTNQPKPAILPPLFAELGQHIGRLAAENQSLLERAIAVQTRIVRIVARACAPSMNTTQYNHMGIRAPSSRTAALALSTRA